MEAKAPHTLKRGLDRPLPPSRPLLGGQAGPAVMPLIVCELVCRCEHACKPERGRRGW